jgi:hypothetical protein
MIVFLAACEGGSPGSIAVWIDVPIDGLVFPSLQPISVEGHVSTKSSVERVEIWVNGALNSTLTDLEGKDGLYQYNLLWTPSAPGEYTIQAIAFAAGEEASLPDIVRITFLGATPSLAISQTVAATHTLLPTVGTATPPPTQETPSVTPTQEAVIEFWAVPPVIDAGGCTHLK